MSSPANLFLLITITILSLGQIFCNDTKLSEVLTPYSKSFRSDSEETFATKKEAAPSWVQKKMPDGMTYTLREAVIDQSSEAINSES